MQGEDQHRWLLTSFALTLLHRGLQKGSLAERTGTNLAMLDGILRPLAAAVQSRHAAVASLALRSLALLLGFPLPGTSLLFCAMISASSVPILHRQSEMP